MNGKQFDWGFYILWVAAGVVTLSLGMFAGFSTIWTVGDFVEGAAGETAGLLAAGLLFGGLTGLGMSLGPAFILGRRGIAARRWLLAGTAGGGAGGLLLLVIVFGIFAVDTIPEELAGLLIGLLIGGGIGTAQWLALRGKIEQLGMWIPVNIVALGVGFAVGLPLGGEGRELLAFSVTALIISLITGAGMTRLSARRLSPSI